MRDRTVHAITDDGLEIVRYDRSGKWYWETETHRKHITISEAVRLATRRGSTHLVGLPGGSRFEALCAKAPGTVRSVT